MHVIIFDQQVLCLISFYKFFNDMYFTHQHLIFLLGSTYVIFLLWSNVGRYLQFGTNNLRYLLSHIKDGKP